MPVTKWKTGCGPGRALAAATADASVAFSRATTRVEAHDASVGVMPSNYSKAGLAGVPHSAPNTPVVGSGYSVTNTFVTLFGTLANTVASDDDSGPSEAVTVESSAVQSEA